MKPCKKTGYKDKEDAIRVMHKIQAKKDGNKKPIRTYECELCNFWHITSQTNDDRIAREPRTKLKFIDVWKTLM